MSSTQKDDVNSSAAHSGIASSWDYTLVYRTQHFPVSQMQPVYLISALSLACVFIDRAYLPVRSAHTHLLPVVISSSGYLLCVSVALRSARVSYLFWGIVVLQNKRPWVKALLCEWALLYSYPRVQVAVVEVAAALLSPTAFQFAVTSCALKRNQRGGFKGYSELPWPPSVSLMSHR